eukprot:scaffold90509_cov87-Cyclotella_meneghiniana.AAC.1
MHRRIKLYRKSCVRSLLTNSSIDASNCQLLVSTTTIRNKQIEDGIYYNSTVMSTIMSNHKSKNDASMNQAVSESSIDASRAAMY